MPVVSHCDVMLGSRNCQEFYELAGVEGAEAMASSAQDEDVAENEAEDELDLEGLEEEGFG